MSSTPPVKPPSDALIDSATQVIVQAVRRERSFLITDSVTEYQDQDVIDQEISALETTIDAVGKRLQRRLADAKKRRNDLAPLSKIPAELLIDILLHSLDEVRTISFYQRVKTLSEVCMVWHTVINNTAQFWARLHSNFSSSKIERILQRSGNALLTVECAWFPISRDAKSFVNTLVPSADRIRSLTVTRDFSNQTEVSKLVGRKIEHLEYRTDSDSCQIALGNREKPLDRLQSLVLESAYLPWPALKRMQTLRLFRLSYNGPSLEQLWVIIVESPSLRHLILNHVSITRTSASSASTVSTYNLPSLKQLHLVHLSQSDTNTILNGIRAPQCSDTRIACHFDSHSSTSLPVLVSLEQTIGNLREAFNAGRGELHIELSASALRCRTGGLLFNDSEEEEGERIIIAMEGVPPYEAMTWLFRALNPPDNRNVTLSLGVGFNVTDPSFVHAVDHGLRFVTDLHLFTNLKIDPLLKQLGRQVAHNGAPTWPMPRLCALDLGSERFSTRTLVNVMGARYKGRRKEKRKGKGKGKGPTNAPKPALLKSLFVLGRESMDETCEEEIEEMLGSGVLDWDLEDEDYDDYGGYSDEYGGNDSMPDYWEEDDYPFSAWY